MGDFWKVFPSKPNLEPTEPLVCPQKPNLEPTEPPKTEPNLELNQVRPNTKRTLLPAKMRRAKKNFSSIYALSRKFPELNS